jgi:hypothetical protein
METTKERRGAQADHDRWSRAAEVLAHWNDAVRLLGSDELIQVMEKAEAEALYEVGRTRSVLEAFEAAAPSDRREE